MARMESSDVIASAKATARELAPLSSRALGVAIADLWEDVYAAAGTNGYADLMATHLANLAVATVREELGV